MSIGIVQNTLIKSAEFVEPMAKAAKTVISKIYEEKSFKSIGQHITRRTLLVFDYDNTIGRPGTKAKPKQVAGSDQHFEHRIKVYTSKGHSVTRAVDLALMEWFGIQCFTKAMPVEEDTPAYISKLQDEGHMIMGLTTRSAALAIPTHEQLTSMGIDLTRTAPKKEEVIFLNPVRAYLTSSNDNRHEVKFRYGVLFTSGTHKGEAFGTFLDLVSDVYPIDSFDTVLFINDKKKDLLQLQEKVDALGKSFIGIRYSYMDEEIRTADMAEADRQLDALRRVLIEDDVPAMVQDQVGDNRKIG